MNLDLLHSKIPSLPNQPGVYFFKDAQGTILYVGKATDLKHRVSSYFQRPEGKDLKTLTMLRKASDVEYIVTRSEKEALILEDNLIKEHHPRYNIRFRDDKRYLCLRLSLQEEFPVLSLVRRVRKDGALYFGPYPSARSLRETLNLIRRFFPIRTSLDTRFAQRLPDWEKIDPAHYWEAVQQVRLFLEGKDDDLIAKLREKMEGEAARLNFEAAARIRDQIEHLQKVLEKQRIVSRQMIDQDVIGMYRQRDEMAIYLLFVRGGRLLGGKGVLLSPADLSAEEVLESFIPKYYGQGNFLPRQILLPVSLSSRSILETLLSERRGEKVWILSPIRGEKKALLDLARDNAEKFYFSRVRPTAGVEELLSALKEKLHLHRVPRRIEAFDISDLGGEYAVGSMVCFADGQPLPQGYRHFRVKTITGADDYGMMSEVLRRRYQRVQTSQDLPDLVLVDGGRGQLNIAREVFQNLRISEVDLISLAKEREGEGPSGVEKTGEKIFHPDFVEPILLEKHSPVLNFLDRVRDEAHRFAIRHHRKVRGKGAIQTRLEEIPRIGPARQRGLLEFFGSLEKIGEASEDELSRAPKMSRKAAAEVHRFFHPPNEELHGADS